MDSSRNIDPFATGSTIALIVGVVLVIGAFYARRHGKLRDRKLAALLAAVVGLIGAAVFGWGAYAMLKGDAPRPVDMGAYEGNAGGQ